jgi:hypothetical protein
MTPGQTTPNVPGGTGSKCSVRGYRSAIRVEREQPPPAVLDTD